MIIKKVVAKQVLDSRKKPTIQVVVQTDKGSFKTCAPSGKSTGKFEVSMYKKSVSQDIKTINKINIKKLNKLNLKKFNDLKKFERFFSKKIGGNSLFTFEASLLKAMAKEEKSELF